MILSGIILFLLSGCGDDAPANGGGTPTPAPIKKVNVCTLVTADDMAQVVGNKFSATPKEGKAAGENYCAYKNLENANGPVSNITLLTRDGAVAWKSMVDQNATSPDRYIKTDVDGTEAIFEQAFSRLWLYKNEETLIVSLAIPKEDGSGNDASKGLELSKQLAQIALKRL